MQILHFGPLMSCFRCFDILFARCFVCTVGAVAGADADGDADETADMDEDGDVLESGTG